MEDKKVIYALTANDRYKQRETEDFIAVPVQKVKGFLHTKMQDSRILDMTVDGKRVQVDLGSDVLSNLSGDDKKIISRCAITEERPITIKVDKEGFNMHIAGLPKNICKQFNEFDHAMPKSLVEHKILFPNNETEIKGKLVEIADHGPVLQDENGNAALYNIYNFYEKDYIQLKQNGADMIGKQVHIQIDKNAELVTPMKVLAEKENNKPQATVWEDENELEDQR